MTELKTLKDLIIEDHNPNNSYVNEIVLVEELKQEASNWVKEIDNDINMYYKRLRRKTVKNTDVTNAQRWHLRKWIIKFFNLTEEDLK